MNQPQAGLARSPIQTSSTCEETTMPDNLSPAEVADFERTTLIKEANDRAAIRIGRATSIGAADAARSDLKFAVKRIEAFTDAQLIEKANSRLAK